MKTSTHTLSGLFAPIDSENGSAIVVAMLVLVLLTIFGMTSLTTTDSELKVVRGERDYLQDFFVADSAWKVGALWLDGSSIPPVEINSVDDNIVKNFGDDGADVYNTEFPEGTQDGVTDGVPYWYNMTEQEDTFSVNLAGNTASYRQFWYTADANADRSQQIRVELSKIYKTQVNYQ